jgi:hypothetical protein
MLKNRYTLVIITLFFLKTISVVSQNKASVNSFIKTVFFEKYKIKTFADEYIYFEPTENVKYTINNRLKILEKHLKKIKKEKSPFTQGKRTYDN